MSDTGSAEWKPRHLFLALGSGFLAICAALPLRAQLALGKGMGSLLYLLVGPRLKIARINLQICFPEMPEEQRDQLLKEHVQSLGMGLFDTAAAWYSRDSLLRSRYVIEGAEHLDAALARGRGVLLLGAHFTTQELGVRMLSYHYDLHGVYRRHADPVQEARVKAARLRRFADMIPSDDMRKTLKYLKRGKIVWYTPDQDFGEYGMEHSCFVPFFGKDAATVTVPGRLAQKTGAALVPFFFRREGKARYRLKILPPLDACADDPVAEYADAEYSDAEYSVEVAREFNALLEAEVREVPEQYLWVHQRFKTRPGGGESPYSEVVNRPA